MIFEYKRRIFGFECDIYGHLNNSNYLNLYEEARAIALEEMEVPIRESREKGISIYLIRIEMDFKKGVQLEDEIKIKSYVEKINRLKSVWIQEIYDSSNEICNQVKIEAVFIKDGKPARISKSLFSHFKKYAE